MKNILILLLVSFFAVMDSYAGKGFTTTFDITDIPDTVSVEISIHDSERGFRDPRFATIQLVNGRGVLADVSRLKYPVRAYASTPYGNIEFYIGNDENERISGNAADIENLNLKFEGAPWSEDLMEFNRLIQAPTKILYDKMMNGGGQTGEQRDSVRMEGEAIEKHKQQYYLEHPNSWVTLDMTTSILSACPRDLLENIFSSLSPDRRESQYGATLGKYLSLSQISEGSALIDYDIVAADQYGRTFRLSDMTEPYIVVDFSECYCGPCIKAVEEIRELREKYPGKIGFVNYSCDELEKLWRKALKRDNLEWPSLFDGTGPAGEVCLKYNVSSFPSFFIFGPDRKLVKSWNGWGPGAIEHMLPEEAKE